MNEVVFVLENKPILSLIVSNYMVGAFYDGRALTILLH